MSSGAEVQTHLVLTSVINKSTMEAPNDRILGLGSISAVTLVVGHHCLLKKSARLLVTMEHVELVGLPPVDNRISTAWWQRRDD